MKRVLLIPVGLAAAALIFLGADLGVHAILGQYAAGLNVRGYRGPILGAKRPGERRIVALGGSTTFGYGVRWQDAWPAQLAEQLNARPGTRHVWTVANLGYNNEGAYADAFTLRDYEALAPDLVILYSGYNDGGRNEQIFRRQSWIFRRTGYLPILPLLAAEVPRWWRQADPSRIFRVPKAHAGDTRANDDVSIHILTFYVESVNAAIHQALALRANVLVVSPPAPRGYNPMFLMQQDAIEIMVRDWRSHDWQSVERAWSSHSGAIAYLNLRAAVATEDSQMSYDGMHLTVLGNRVIASRLHDPVTSLLP